MLAVDGFGKAPMRSEGSLLDASGELHVCFCHLPIALPWDEANAKAYAMQVKRKAGQTGCTERQIAGHYTYYE
eukprot:1746412-Amphidinium_carterae.1